jgi:hypothetical protein
MSDVFLKMLDSAACRLSENSEPGRGVTAAAFFPDTLSCSEPLLPLLSEPRLRLLHQVALLLLLT